MSEVHLRHINKHLGDAYLAHVDLTDLRAGKGAPEHTKNSRALAAFALAIVAGVDPVTACAHVVDGFQDNGIDAVYVDPAEHCMYIVQSKWSHDGGGGVSAGDMAKLVQGVRDLQRANFEPFNDRVRKHHAALAAALDDAKTRFEIVLITTTEALISPDSRRSMDEFLAGVNSPVEIVQFRHLTQVDLYRAVVSSSEADPIDLEVMLHEWGHVTQPNTAFYGQVNVSDVARWWEEHRHRLFSKNLRSFLGDSAVNDAIAETLQVQPERFWYLNNGLTILCDSVRKKPLGGDSRSTGIFQCQGAAVVNGAQTVGTIGRQRGERLGDARVMVRLISLDAAAREFANAVTRATNTQNRIDPRDFAALDEQQKRLQEELGLDKLRYVYRSGEPAPADAEGCTIEEATVALACASPDLQLTVVAKGSVGKLWGDIAGPPYTTIFNRGTSGVRLWWAVRVLRVVEKTLADYRAQGIDIQRQVAVHGNRFILRQVFRMLAGDASFDPERIASLTAGVLDRVEGGFVRVVGDAYIAWAFKTPTRCEQLERELFGNLFTEPVVAVPAAERKRRVEARANGQLSLFGGHL